MNKDILIKKLKSLKPILQKEYGIEELAIFGSVARDEAKKDSDIDIAIIKSKEKDYFKLIGLKYFLKQKLGKEIDIGYYDAIRDIFKKYINKDLIYV